MLTVTSGGAHERNPHNRFSRSPPVLPDSFDADVLKKPRDADAFYDARLGYALALISGWSYASPAVLSKKLQYYGLIGNSVQTFEVTNDAMLVVSTAYFIRSHCGELGIIAFRGTPPMNFINWLTDIEVTWRDFDYGRVHSGFFNNVEAIWGDLFDALQEATSPVQPSNGHGTPRKPLRSLYITGHSLGGAMAVMAAARLKLAEETGAPDVAATLRGVYTYGQPMVGDKAFNERCKFPLFRHVYAADLVCRMPPRMVDSAFEHFGEERFTDATTSPWQVSNPLRAKQAVFVLATIISAAGTFVTRRIGVLRRLNLPYSLDDHSPTNYVEASRTTARQR